MSSYRSSSPLMHDIQFYFPHDFSLHRYKLAFSSMKFPNSDFVFSHTFMVSPLP